jgi:hypothetical protein
VRFRVRVRVAGCVFSLLVGSWYTSSTTGRVRVRDKVRVSFRVKS